MSGFISYSGSAPDFCCPYKKSHKTRLYLYGEKPYMGCARLLPTPEYTEHEFPQNTISPQTRDPQTILQLAFFVSCPPPRSRKEAPTLSAGRYRCNDLKRQGQRSAHPNASSPPAVETDCSSTWTIGKGCRFFYLGVYLIFASSCFS